MKESDEWVSIRDKNPAHMQIVRVYIENPLFGSFERTRDAVYLHFKGSEEGDFYDSREQILLYYVTKWKKSEEKIYEVNPH